MAMLTDSGILAYKLFAVWAADMGFRANNELGGLSFWQPTTLLKAATVNTVCEEREYEPCKSARNNCYQSRYGGPAI